VTLTGGEQKRREPAGGPAIAFVAVAEASATFARARRAGHHVGVAFLGGPHQRGLAVELLHVRIGAVSSIA